MINNEKEREKKVMIKVKKEKKNKGRRGSSSILSTKNHHPSCFDESRRSLLEGEGGGGGGGGGVSVSEKKLRECEMELEKLIQNPPSFDDRFEGFSGMELKSEFEMELENNNNRGEFLVEEEEEEKEGFLWDYQIFDSEFSEDSSQGTLGPSKKYDQETSKPPEKVLRRLAQNREAARKSRLRKKVYLQQLETSRLKLSQIEQDLERARQQGVYAGGGLDSSHVRYSGTVNSGVAAFEMEYGHWIEEQNRQTRELRTALQAHITDIELRMLVDSVMNHYYELFPMKAAAAKADVFYLMSGMWKTSAERFFQWIGGYRPSELLKVLSPHLDPLTEQQLIDVCSLQQSSQQAEDALSQVMTKLHETVAETLATDLFSSGNYMPQMAGAIGKLEALVSFVNQADHLRQQSLQQMPRILTTRQAARGLLALGDYFQRFRALSSIWSARPREPA